MEYGSARNVLISGRQVDPQNLKEIRDLPEKQKKGREKEIRTGAQFLESVPRFPSRRGCKDLPWAVFFLLTVAAVIAFVLYSVEGIDTKLNEDAEFRHHKTHDGLVPADIWRDALTVNFAVVASCIAGLAAAFFWVMAAKACPTPVVYISLYLVPCLFILGGLFLMATAFALVNRDMSLVSTGGVLALIGICQLACVMCCWAQFIPFTIEVVGMVATVSNENPCLVAVSALGGFFNAVWVVLLLIGYAALNLKHNEDTVDQNKGIANPVDLSFLMILMWGSSVIYNVCHTTYAGVFSRWYFSLEGSYLFPSLKVATTTSFGSICFGTFIVAAINTVQELVSSVREAFAEDGNVVGCVMALIVECIIDCIGNMLEYFNAWVYVQCAIRGGTFCESARATCAMIACNGIKAIIGDLLVDRVVALGTFLSGIAGLVVGGCIACSRDEIPDSHVSRDAVRIAGFLGGFVGGMVTGGGVMTIFSSGTKAIIMCWAEEPNRLHEEHDFEDVHTEFNAKVQDWN